jgi:hypothetical protein
MRNTAPSTGPSSWREWATAKDAKNAKLLGEPGSRRRHLGVEDEGDRCKLFPISGVRSIGRDKGV